MKKNATKEQEAYAEITARLLGLSADAKPERMTPKAMAKIDEFLKELDSCSRLPKMLQITIKELIKLMLPRPISDLVSVIDAIYELEKQIKKQNKISAACYFAAKRKYAQELQFIFFEEN